ncbi:anthranilate phosphoribosyltransferase [Nocardiopsis salina]|uniref:anthranilate phosphoribosyltransferase n=1 Tax=Nocardiopsis salina TaxID=245836 RepID=UPI0003451DB4|nr:hypothetical protein [Nocardiopsis salina]
MTGLLGRRPVADPEIWRSLWDLLGDGGLNQGQAAALLASLTTRTPDPETLDALLASLGRHPAGSDGHWPGTVNVVGTGGGPSTFNVSTAAAFVAAGAGVRVVKTGSRAYASALGSHDLLEHLGVRLTASSQQTADTLEHHGIAFAGPYVYPVELARLARTLAPISMRPFGRFLNTVGPFLANLPVTAQVTGVSDRMPLEALRGLAARATGRKVWLCHNLSGADELLPFSENTIESNGSDLSGGRLVLHMGDPVPVEGGIDDLRGPEDPAEAVRHFLGVLSGGAGETAVRTVCLNAAALAVASGHTPSWREACRAARESIDSGAARAVAERMRSDTGDGHASPRRSAVAHG